MAATIDNTIAQLTLNTGESVSKAVIDTDVEAEVEEAAAVDEDDEVVENRLRKYCGRTINDNRQINFESSSETEPLSILNPKKSFTCRSQFEDVKPGSYSVVWCISRKEGPVHPPKMTFDVKTKSDTWSKVLTAEYSEIGHRILPAEKDVKLVLSQRLWIAPHLVNLKIDCSMEIDAYTSAECTEDQEYVKLHWFELQPWSENKDQDAEEFIINPPSILLDSLNVNQPGRPTGLYICSHSVALSGKYAATLSIAGSIGYLDLWELSQEEDKANEKDGIVGGVNKTPLGSVSIDVSAFLIDKKPKETRLMVDVSPDGSQIVVFQEPGAKETWDDEYCEKMTKEYLDAQTKNKLGFQGQVFKYDASFTPAETTRTVATNQGEKTEVWLKTEQEKSSQQQGPKLLVNQFPGEKPVLGFKCFGKFHRLPIVNESMALEKKKAREDVASRLKDKVSGGIPDSAGDEIDSSSINQPKSQIAVDGKGDVCTSVELPAEVDNVQGVSVDSLATQDLQQSISSPAVETTVNGQDTGPVGEDAAEKEETNDKDNMRLVFVACDGINVTAYDAQGNWKVLYTVSLKGLESSYNDKSVDARDLIDNFAGLFFHWNEGSQVISFWNIMNGLNVSYIAWGEDKEFSDAAYIAVSENASVVVVAAGSTMMSYYVESGLPISTVDLDYIRPVCMTPIAENESLVIQTSHTYTGNVCHHVRDMATLSLVANSQPSPIASGQDSWGQVEGEILISEELRLNRYQVIPSDPPIADYGDSGMIYTRRQLGMFGDDRKATFSPPGANWWYRLHIYSRKVNKYFYRNSVICLTLYKESATSTTSVLELTPEPFYLISPATDPEIHKLFETGFLPCGTRFVINAFCTVQIWSLPSETEPNCTLQNVITRASPDRRIFTTGQIRDYYERLYNMFVARDMDTIRVSWEDPDDANDYTEGVVEFVSMPVVELFDSRLALYCVDSIPALISMHSAADASTQKTIIRYVRQYIVFKKQRGSSSLSGSVMERVVLCCKLTGFKEFLSQLLADDPGHTSWVPRYSHVKDVWDDHISFLLSHAKLEYAKMLIDYCVRQSKIRNAMFVEPLMASLPVLMTLYPELALQVSKRVAYTPVSRTLTTFLQTNAVNPKLEGHFNSLYGRDILLPRLRSKLMQNPSRLVGESIGYDFEGQLYMAPFSLLWTLKTRKLFLSQKTVEQAVAHPFSLEYFDNPAMAALLQFKWNQNGLQEWLKYFVVRVIFYAFVLKVTFEEIYHGDLAISALRPYLIVVIAFACFMFATEVHQMRGSFVRHFASPYNWFDMLVCVIPFATSVQSLVYAVQDPDQLINHHASRLVSFSILVVYLQIIFELRVFKGFCNNATIIVSIVWRISVFFSILVIAIVGFAHGFLHLLHTHYAAHCANRDLTANPDSTCEDSNGPLFPTHFGSALSTTYFFLAGRYDAVTAEMDQQDWAFHIMLALFFFVTTVLMMNVLIALMNSVYSDRESAGALIWRENRLRDVEASQNVMYRTNHDSKKDLNPKHIYFLATEIEVTEHREKFLKAFSNDYRPFMTEKLLPTFTISPSNIGRSGFGKDDWSATPGTTTAAVPPTTAAAHDENVVTFNFPPNTLIRSASTARLRQRQQHNNNTNTSNSAVNNLSAASAGALNVTRPPNPAPEPLGTTIPAVNQQQIQTRLEKMDAMQQDLSNKMKEMQDLMMGMHAIMLQQNSNSASRA